MTLTNSQVFLNELGNIAASYVGKQGSDPILINAINVMRNFNLFGTSTPVGNNGLNTALPEFNAGNTTDFTSFINNYYIKALNYPSTSQIPALAYDPSSPQSPLNGLYNAYTYILGINNPDNQDLNIINDPNIATRFKAVFTDFIQNFPFQILTNVNGSIVTTIDGITYLLSVNSNYGNFITNFFRYQSTTAVVQNSSISNILSILTNPSIFGPTAPTYIQSFQSIYEAFNGPVGTLPAASANWTVAQRVFVQRLSSFYTSELRKTTLNGQPQGFFDPSKDLGDWYDYTQSLYYNPQFVPNSIVANPRSTIVLDQVLRLLISLIGVIQTVAAAQANTLNFLSQWQTSYTNKLNQLHTFAVGDGTVIGTFNATLNNAGWDQNAAQSTRNALNNVNQSYISKLQANQQTISDTSKSLQSNVNQSNDAANQQGSVADSILQELSTILSSIFR